MNDFGPWIEVPADCKEMPRELVGVQPGDWEFVYACGLGSDRALPMTTEHLRPELIGWEDAVGDLRKGAFRIRCKSEVAEGWIEHHGGPRPCDEDVRIDVMHRDGAITRGRAGDWFACWSHEVITDGDIVAYRLRAKPDEPSSPAPIEAWGLLYTYDTSTTTPQATYTDPTLATLDMLARDLAPAKPAPTQTLRWPQPWCPESNLTRVAPMSVRGIWGEQS